MRLISLLTVFVFSFSTLSAPFAAAAQLDQQAGGTTATVATEAPIFIQPGAATPLRVAAVNTTLNVMKEEGEWAQVEFNDPQWGRRIGWIETKYIKISRASLRPMDLSVNKETPSSAASRPQDAPDRAAPRSAPQGNVDPAADDSMVAGMLDGETLAQGSRVGGKAGVGFAVGALTGLLGTGVGYFVVGPAPMTPEAMARYKNKSSDYQLGFKQGWEKKSQSKKRNSFLKGGLIGTAVLVVAFVALVAASDDDIYYY